MIYKFKSKSTSDVIMMEPNARQILDIIGKGHGPTGIVEVSQMPAAIAALQHAIGAMEGEEPAAVEGEEVDHAHHEVGVSLKQRAAPFLDMLRRSSAEGNDIIWGV